MADLSTLEVISRNWILMTFIFVLSSSVASAYSPCSSAMAGTASKSSNEDQSNGKGQQEDQDGAVKCATPCEDLETMGCKCRHYEYMLKGRVREFYNIEQCTGISQVPQMPSTCRHHLILLASFSNNPLGTIPPFAFSGLRILSDEHFIAELILSNTSLVSIDLKAFYGMHGVFLGLDLSHNLLTTLPPAILSMQGLEKLLLNDNQLRMESFEELKSKTNNGSSEEFFSCVQVIDLSNNQLIGIPKIVPASRWSNLKEISLHGNPITQDLSAFVPMLTGYPRLEKITWPLKTMTCSCLTMAIIARDLHADFNFRAIYISSHEGHFPVWKPVTCDRDSEAAFIGLPIGFLSNQEIARVCLEKVRPFLFHDETVDEPIVSPALSSNGGQQEKSNMIAAQFCLLLSAMNFFI